MKKSQKNNVVYKLPENKLLKRIADIDDRMKVIVSSIAFFLIALNSMIPSIVLQSTGMDTVLGFGLCLLCVILNQNGSIVISQTKIILMMLCGALGILALISGVYFGVYGYISYGVFQLTIVEILICSVNSKKQIENIMTSLSIGACGAFIVLWGSSVLFGPISWEQYESFTGNPNALGSYAAVGLCAVVYLRLKFKGNIRFFFSALEGVSIGFIIFTRSRTALLVIIALFILFAIYYIVNQDRKKLILRSIKHICIYVIFMYVAFISVTGVYNHIGMLDNEDIVTKMESTFVVNLDSEYCDEITFADMLFESSKRSMKGINDDNSFSSGRIGIWKYFGKEINMIGHENGTMVVGDSEPFNAHNGYIQVAYSYGLIAGIIYLLLTIYMAFLCIRKFNSAVKERKISNELCYTYLIFVAFFIFSMLSSTVAPFSYYLVLMLSCAAIPAIGNKDL